MKPASLAALSLITCLACAVPARAGDLEEGIVQYRIENFEEAQALLEKARAAQPGSSVAAFYLGLARKQAGDLSGAIKDLNDAATLTPPVLDAYLELADAYHVQGDEPQALVWVRRSEEAGVKPAQSAFLKGMILAGQGKRDEALAAFADAKRRDARLAQAADLQIAMLLAGSRKFDRARDALRAVVAVDPSSEIASYAKEYEQSFARIVESYRPLRLSVGLNYLYDDNAISSPSDAAARAQIGNPTGQRDHAFLGSFRLDYTPMTSDDFIFNAQYLLQSTKYGDTNTDQENPSTIINSVTLNPGLALGDSVLSLPVNYSHVMLKEEKYQQLYGLRPTWSWQLAPRQIVQVSAGYTRRDMLQAALAPDENRDANQWGAALGHIYSFGNEGGMLAARYEWGFDKTTGSNWENRSHKFSVSTLVPLAERVRLNLSGDVTIQDYLNVNSIFDVRRDDTTWFGSGGVSWNVTENVILSAQYSHTAVRSNIKVYDYDRNTVSTGIEFNF
ncbi:tetratricopeptide repeat protein [Geomonas azotofigens]|uniref:tetratricopeptide repeat protein n=1 Tax=Geomonas azotofigens TaxID=2843196 RepID=UPI001F29B708|nr:tetratricopeptide repeat protein [Geomonas azotofigens]